MEPAIALCYDYSTPFEDCVEFARDAGFRVVSLGMNTAYSGFDSADGRKRIARVLGEVGMELDNIHAANSRLAALESEVHEEAVADALTSIEAAAELGAGKVVLHLWGGAASPEPVPGEAEQGKRALDVLLPRARTLGVMLALENSWSASYVALFEGCMAAFDDPLVGFCYDTSRDQLFAGGRMDLLQQYGHRLAAVHVSDNRGEQVNHILPWQGVIDWERFTALLSRTSYRGPMLLETKAVRSGFGDLAGFTREAVARARRLIAMVG